MAETVRVSWRGCFVAVGRALLGLPAPLAFLLPWLWMGLLWNLSSQSFPKRPDRLGLWSFFSNLAHAPLFGMLALAWCALLLRPRPREGLPALGPRKAALIVGLVGLYGCVDEWHQSLTPDRDPSVGDVATDVAGALGVVWIVGYLGSGAAGGGEGERGLRRRLLVAAAFVAAVVLVGGSL